MGMGMKVSGLPVNVLSNVVRVGVLAGESEVVHCGGTLGKSGNKEEKHNAASSEHLRESAASGLVKSGAVEKHWCW